MSIESRDVRFDFPDELLERELKTRLALRAEQQTLPFRLAYTAGYEALTYQLVCFAMRGRKR